MPIKADYHIHSNFSEDSTASMDSMIEQAIALNYDRLCFTDHMDYEFPKKYDNVFEFNVPEYFEALKQLKEKYRSSINILTGIEVGLKPPLNQRYEPLLSNNNFDFVIGSTHLIDDIDPYYSEYWDLLPEDEAHYHYFETVLDNIKSFKSCDVYGHIDYVVRYGPNKNKNYSYSKYQDIIDLIFKEIINSGKGIEINTAGYKYGLNNPHPHIDVLKRYYELGGELITFGSDAHTPEHIGYNFNQVSSIVKDIGFKYYAVFENRKPIFEKL